MNVSKPKIIWKVFVTILAVIGCSFIVLYFYLNPAKLAPEDIGTIRRTVILASLLPLLLASVVALILARSFSRSLERISEVADRIAKGDFSKRLYSSVRDEMGDLTQSINRMAAGLEKQVVELQNEKRQLMTILNGMIEGVLVTNPLGEIVLINPALRSMLDLTEEPLGKTILECLRNAAIHNSVEMVLQERKPKEEEISVLVGQEERNVVVHTAPLGADSGSVSVFYDVTNIRRLENVRKEFVANVSHELKTPLTCITGYAETLKHGALDDRPAAERFIDKIESNAAQLRNLVEDILRLSEIESGRLEMILVPTDLRKSVETVLEGFSDLVKAKKMTCEDRVPASTVVKADTQVLRQILVNLIENAIKYTPEGGRVVVSAEAGGEFCRVTVKDSGIGISEMDLPRVFERFYRVDKARSRQTEGTGLGLAIVKHFVQAHGGEVGVKSEVGKGSEFWFTIPV